MARIDTVVIGAGQAGLAMSWWLRERGVEHVVFERGRVAERWRSERWDSLRLLTPNWLTRLPGFRYDGPDADGFMTMPEVVAFFDRYRASFHPPIEEATSVSAVEQTEGGFAVVTDRGSWQARHIVIATGHCDAPFVPPVASALPPRTAAPGPGPGILQIAPSCYRRPGQLPDGGVLVVGASASGLQLADEIHRSGRPVTLSVGRHTRLPRRYRGRDILWWFDAMGLFDDTAERVYDIEVSRRQTSLQLIGQPDHASLDLPTLERRGVRLAGRLVALEDHTARFADDLVAYTAAADVRMASLLARIDAFAERTGLDGVVGPREPFVPFLWPAPPPTALDLRQAGIRTILWATGYRRDYSWLRVPVLDRRGEICHQAGVTPVEGLYVLGLHFLRRRRSSFIDGVGDDARVLSGCIAAGRREGMGASRDAPAEARGYGSAA